MENKFGNKTVKELLEVKYKEYGIPAGGGVNQDHVKIEFTKKIYAYIPNFQVRKDVVLKHDTHHLLTDTPFNLIGETEIAMWEIAAGCWRHWFAFLINSTIIPLGIMLNLPRLFKAFVRGRRSQSLYDNRYTEEEFMNMKAIDLYNELELNTPQQAKPATFLDYLVFVAWLISCGIANILVLVTVPFILLYNIYIFGIVRPETA